MSQYTPILQTVDKLVEDFSHGRFYEFAQSHDYPTAAEYVARLGECVEQMRALCEESEKQGETKGDGNEIS